MKTIIVACETIEDELRFAMDKVNVSYPVKWLESGLHIIPKKLNAALSEILADIKAERVLVALGFCGNSILGIKAGNYEMIIPRADDCISILLGSVKERLRVSSEYAAYFLTEGWLRGERTIWVEYQHLLEKYGEEMADSLMEMMIGNYRTLGLLDCGVGSIEELVESTKEIADALKLKQEIIPAALSWLELFLTGPWSNDNFIIKQPYEEIVEKDLVIYDM